MCLSPLASAMASEPRFVLLFKFLNWSSFSNLSARVRLTQVVFFWVAHSSTLCQREGRKSPILIFINQYFLIQECLLIPLCLNSISKLERMEEPIERHQVDRSSSPGRQNHPNDQKYFSRKTWERERLSWKFVSGNQWLVTRQDMLLYLVS